MRAISPERRLSPEAGSAQEWIPQNEVMVPAFTMPLDRGRINALVATIISGLFNYEFGFTLHRHWQGRITRFAARAKTQSVGPGSTLSCRSRSVL
jgi:hypothetical protein